jgi:hypothetical protein
MIKNEREFHSLFVKMARERGWHVAQFRPARTQVGGETQWRTPVGADGKGYPDFTLVRERIFWAELKGERGSLSPEQKVWIDKLRLAGAEVYVWKPRHMEEIIETLRPPTVRDERLIAASSGDAHHAAGVARMLG